MDLISNYKAVKNKIDTLKKKVTLIAISKTFSIEYIQPILDLGHTDFGENKVQESKKWISVKKNLPLLKLHLVGKLQRNKVKYIFDIFDVVHSLDSIPLAIELDKQEKIRKKNLDYFIQVNLGNENQKSGVFINDLDDFFNFCKTNTNLNIIGFMCIPPIQEDPIFFFKKLKEISNKYNLPNLSMGMSGDYTLAIECGATHVRIGSEIFGKRSV